MKYFCNPINVPYKYQFIRDPRMEGQLSVNREAADPSLILFKGKYYMFASMSLSVWVSNDLISWEEHLLPEELPLYDYAPDVAVGGEYVYFCASRRGEICDYYRTKDVLGGPYERIAGTFDFWDPHLFFDDDGKIYFYWGCSNTMPIQGVELALDTMRPVSVPVNLITGDPYERGYERIGEDHSLMPATEEEVERAYEAFMRQNGQRLGQLPKGYEAAVRGMFTRTPYIEGPWMTKYNGRYYLQYAAPGTQYNGYADAVFVADHPLGPFVIADNNPYSYHPGGFMPGAGHGSTLKDKRGRYWHTSTMRISVNHMFERRVGLWPAGFDEDGQMWCNQAYGDWPIAVSDNGTVPVQPPFMLLSGGCEVSCSSSAAGHPAIFAVDEDCRTCWMAEGETDGKTENQWIMVDLGTIQSVCAVQVNFADADRNIPSPGEMRGSLTQARFIDPEAGYTRWYMEGSSDGEHFFVLEDQRQAESDLPHPFVLIDENGRNIRYVRLTITEVPYGVQPCISGLRVFGWDRTGSLPEEPVYKAEISSDGLDLIVRIRAGQKAVYSPKGYQVYWGTSPDKLYHSCQVNCFSDKEIEGTTAGGEIVKRIGALVKGQPCWVRVDAFNRTGITCGETIQANG